MGKLRTAVNVPAPEWGKIFFVALYEKAIRLKTSGALYDEATPIRNAEQKKNLAKNAEKNQDFASVFFSVA